MAWYDDPEEVRKATARALGVGLPDVIAEEESSNGFNLSTSPEAVSEVPVETGGKNWWDDPETVKDIESRLNLQVFTPQRPQRGIAEELGVGFSRGIDQTQALGYGLIGLMGEALGVKPVSDFGLEGYTRNMEEAAQNMASIQDPFEEIGGVGDAGLYAAGILGEQIPQLVLSLAGGGIGGYAAKTVAKKVVANEIAKRLTAGMAKEEAEKAVAKLVAQKALMGFANQAEKQAITKAAEQGAMAGAYVANTGQIAGGSFGQIEQETGQRDPVNALGFALLGGALETAGEAVMAAPIAKKLLGTAAADAIQSGARKVEGKALGFDLGPKAQAAAQLVASPAAEAGTEYAQTGLEQAAVGAADPNRTIAEVVGTPEAEKERLLAATAGAVAGGGFGGISQAASYLIPETSKAVQRRMEQRRAEQGTAVPASPEMAQTASPADEEWSQPVTIQTDNEDYKNLEYRRNKAGQVWAFNVPDVHRFGGFSIPTKYGSAVMVRREFDGASDIRENVKTELAKMADPEAFKTETITPVKPKAEEVLDDAELPEGDAVAAGEVDALEAAAQRRRQRDDEILQRDKDFAQATLSRPQEDAQSFVDGLKELDQVSVLTEDADGNAYSVPMVFVRKNTQGQAILRNEANADKEIVHRVYDPDEFNRITTRQAEADTDMDPASRVLMDALGENPTKQKLESVTGTPWTGKGSKHTWGLKDGLGGTIPVTTKFFNRKSPAEAVAIPERAVNKGFKPEEQGTVPAAPAIETKGPELVAKTSAEFTGIIEGYQKDPKTGVEIPIYTNQRPTRGQENATYLARIDSVADTTIRQMNYLGQPVLVTPETAQSLAEANQFWVEHEERQRQGAAKKDRQPVRFYTQERSDKDGNRNTYITGVTYEGRTYRVGKTPQEFSVDVPISMRGTKSQKRGLGIYNAIKLASPSRIQRSEAAMAGQQAKAAEGPLVAALKGVKGRPALPELNAAENAIYEIYDKQVTQPIEQADVPQEVKDAALDSARGRLATVFAKAKKTAAGAKSQVLPNRQREIGRLVADKVQQFLDAKRALAIEKLREKFDARQAKKAAAKKDARGTGAFNALKMSPSGAINLITEASRNLKTGIKEGKRASQAEALKALQELVDFGALSQAKRDEATKKVLRAAENLTEIDREFIMDQTVSQLADDDRKLAQQQGRKYSRTTAEVAKDRRLVKSLVDLVGSDSVRLMNPYNIGQRALKDAKDAATANAITRPTESLDDEMSGVSNEAALQKQPDDEGDITQGKLAEKGKPVGVEGAQGGSVAPFTNTSEEAMNLLDELPESDRALFLRYAQAEIERQPGKQGQSKQKLSEVERLWANRIKAFLYGNINRQQLEAFREDELRLVERTTPRATASELANLRRGVSIEAALSGVAESRARRSPKQAQTGRPDGAAGTAQDAAGSVPQRTAGETGGRGVQPTPGRTRAVAAASQRDFAGAIVGLGEAETLALPQPVVDRIYQAYYANYSADLAETSNNPVTASAAPAADTVNDDGKLMFERYANALLTGDQLRAADIRKNMAQAYRAGLFEDDPVVTAINRLANDKAQLPIVRTIAKELAKNAKRGVRFDRVALDVGRFTKPKNARASWAGLFSRTPDGGSVVSINLDNLHDKDSVPLTLLHELQHVVISDKVNRRIPLTRTEEAALERLEKLRGEAVVAAARQQGLPVADNPDIAALSKQLYALTDTTQSASGADMRRYAGLANLEEFTIEMIGNPDMVGLLSELGFGEARKEGTKIRLLGAIRDAWNAVVELLTGSKVDPTSPLAMAFKASWLVNFGTDSNPNITDIKFSSRTAEQQRAEMARGYVDQEIAARNLPGTTRDRNRIMREVTGPAPTETEAMRAQMVAATLDMTEPQWTEMAKNQGFEFSDPTAVYLAMRQEAIDKQRNEQQAARDTVQGAESRAVDPNDLIQVGMRVRVTARDANGTRFSFFARPGTDSTMMGAPVRVFQETDKDGATVNRTRVVQADLIEREQPLAMSKTYGEWVPAPVQSAESRAVQRVSPADAGRALLELARQSGDSFFSLPTKLSTSKNLQEVANSTKRPIKVLEGDFERIVATQTDLQDGDEVTYLTGQGILSNGKLVSVDERGMATISNNSSKEEVSVPIKDVVTGINIRVVDETGGDFYIDSAAGYEGAIQNSSAIYQSIYQWAHNNGYKIVQDPRGTSFEGNLRRNAHQISSAHRTQSADHFVPNGKGPNSQLEKMFPGVTPDRRLDMWNRLTFEEKVATLYRAEAAYIEQAVPDLVSMDYDAPNESFIDRETGKRLGRNEAGERVASIIEGAKKEGTPDTERIGIRTVSRYGAAKSALEGSLGPVVEGADNRRPNLEPALYSRAVNRATFDDRERWHDMRVAGHLARIRHIDKIINRDFGDGEETSFDATTQTEMDVEELASSADGVWVKESLEIPKRYGVDLEEWREWANIVAEEEIPKDPRYPRELQIARRDLADGESKIAPDELAKLRLRVRNPVLQELDALDMGLQFYAGPKPIVWGGKAFPNYLRDPEMRASAQENSTMAEMPDFEKALESFDNWISPAAKSENKVIRDAASRLRQAFVDAFGSEPLPAQLVISESRAASRVTPQQDADYLAAVERGDMETAQRMVDEAAKAAGFAQKWFHGTAAKAFNVFRDFGRNFIYFTQTRGDATDWARNNVEYARPEYAAGEIPTPRVVEVYINSDNIFNRTNEEHVNRIVDLMSKSNDRSVKNQTSQQLKESLLEENYEWYEEVAYKFIRQAGFDGAYIFESQDFDPYNLEMADLGILNPNLIKSADPVTRDDQGNVIPLSQRFNEASPDIRFSRAAGRRFVSETETTYNGGKYTRPGLLGGENADLDSQAMDLVAEKKRHDKAAEFFAKDKAYGLNRILKRLYKGQQVPTNLINDALGNLDNPLTNEQFEEIKRLEETDPETAIAKRIAYLHENREKFRRERQAPALEQLPEELSNYLRELGDDLRTLQEQALKLGIPKGDMRAAFTENLGIYLTRSYNAFVDQKGWEKTLRAEDRELGEHSRMGAMRNQIRSTLIGQRADEAIATALSEGRSMTREQAERMAKDGTTAEEVDQILENYIAYTKQEPSSESFSGLRLPGRKNIKSLTRRKQLSDALREFYGQVENPAVNFVTSYAKLSSLIASHEFQTKLKSLGLKEGWFWDPDSRQNTGQRPPVGYELIAGSNDKSLDVLSGLYANSFLVRGLRETFPPNSLEAAQWWLHPFMKATGFSMGLKTVGSIASQIRNYWGSYMVPIAGGNLSIGDILNGTVKKNLKEAHSTALASVFRNYGDNRTQMIENIKALYESGIMGESMTVGLLNDLTQLGKDAAISDDKFIKGFEKYMKRPGKRVWDSAKQVWKKTEQIYGMTDDIFKIFTYLSELDKYQRAFPDMPIEQLRKDAAIRARDIHWTYSKAPAIVSELKKFPFIAPFVTFTTETIRISLNLGKLAIREIKSDNAELQKIGWQRVRGMATVAFGPWALGTLALSAAGLSGDDLEDLRQFLPDWQKNSQIIILGREGNKVNYVDVSYLDPFEVWKKPMTAFFRGLGNSENLEDVFTKAVVGAAVQAASPFTSEQILSGAVMDVMRNVDANGRQVYNPQDTGDQISYAVGKQLASAFAPGTWDTTMRIYKASTGQTSETGRAYNILNETLGVPAGSRVSAVDAEQALGFKASQFLRARREARSIFNRYFLSRGTRSEADVISAYQRSNIGLRRVSERLRREYVAALNLGVSSAKARSILRAAGLDRDSAKMISTGMYLRLTPSEEQQKMATPDRKRAARAAMNAAPAREAL